MQESNFVRDVGVVLLVAVAAGRAMQWAGLSSVVGYLLAGMLVGPFSPAASLVSNSEHIQLLAQIGLVFLMFSVGLGLSLARLQRMGVSILVAVAISSILLFNICRLFGFAMGWDRFQILFLAGTVMISSSAIIIKVLDGLNITHQRAGQLALGMTVLEDIVAVVMLTIFVSMIKVGAERTTFGGTLGTVAAFVLFAVVVAMLVLPRILGMLSEDGHGELRVVAVTGLVLLAAVWALESGYSLALGAFVLGVVVAGTRYKDELANAFEALHTIFGAIFFVAVGMMFDFRVLAEVWWLVVIVTLLTLIARPVACAFGLICAGHSGQNALKAGLALIPIGEFAFVLIQVGKSSNVLSEQSYAMGIGVSMTTAILGPLLMRRADAICSWVEAREPKTARDLIGFYQGWLEALHLLSNASVLWRLTSRRLLHIIMHLLFASSLIIFSKPVYQRALEQIGQGWVLPVGFQVLFWSGFGILLIGPLIAVWRNMEALAMILAEGAAIKNGLMRSMLQNVLKAGGGIVLFGWFLLLVPRGRGIFWILTVGAAALLFYAPLLWRRLLVLHSRFEVEVREKMKAASTFGATSGLPVAVLEHPQQWNLQIDEIILPFRTDHAGRTIGELGIRKRFGCSIMSIDRQGFLIANPTRETQLFSGDKLLLVGNPEQLSLVEQFLRGSEGTRRLNDFDAITMETLELPEHGVHLSKSLEELEVFGRFKIQICAIERGGSRIAIPPSTERLAPRDKLLVLGSHEAIEMFRHELERTEEALSSANEQSQTG
jgi:CPA2 family monovalent cation:H+ antiporter-2